MRLPSLKTIAALALVAVTGACDIDVPDLNNPGAGDLEDNPTATGVNSAATGLLVGNRRNYAQANGYVAQLGILGREMYNFDGADPRFFNELLVGNLSGGSPFGGNFWAGPYGNIRLANTVLVAIDKVPDFSAEEKAGLRGFTNTIIALDLLEVVNTHDTNGLVIDTNRDPREGVAPLVDKAAGLAEIARLLDLGATDLAGGGDAFTFPLSSGYAGFDNPAGFLAFNRGMRARVALYQEDYTGALAALEDSFINDAVTITIGDLNAGVYNAYSTGPGDVVNGLINPNIFLQPDIVTDAVAGDLRLARKTTVVEDGGSGGMVSSDVAQTIYTTPSTPVALIRNEELLLIKAEALYKSGMTAAGIAELNLVRTVSGGLTAVTPTTEEMFDTALLYERRYSLLLEGHRWIDARRLGRITDLPLDAATHGYNVRYPFPTGECDARAGEPRCTLGSRD